MRLPESKFLNELNKLYDQVAERKGSVFLTFKQSNCAGKKKDRQAGNGERFCLVRATDGKRKKISTLVPKERLDGFKDSFNVILRAKMGRLKKRDRGSKSKRAEASQKK